MAAGMGSRFGGGIKQLEPVGLHGEIIMDFSVHDAIAAGFDRVLFIIRRDIEADFREKIGNRIEKTCSALGVSVGYCFQDALAVPGVPEERRKPFGTVHAVLSAKGCIDGPFAVINADDYYGREAFCRMHAWLEQDHADTQIVMAGFVLKNTLSENGSVTRGICKTDSTRRNVLDVVETGNIVKTPGGIESDGKMLDPESIVSMNFWGFPGWEGREPPAMGILEQAFAQFCARDIPQDPMCAECLLPTVIGNLLRGGAICVNVLETGDTWFGMTYREDIPLVVQKFRALFDSGVYAPELYSDLGVKL